MAPKILVVALTALFLSACKINITVPQGGSVQTATGLYACGEFETCELTVDHVYFTETFRAVPRQGYQFVGWQKDSGYLCGGKASNCELTTTSLAGNANLLAVLYSDRDFHLVPMFEQTQTEPVASPDIPVTSKQRQTNYVVAGDSADAIMDAMLGAANPIKGSSDTVGFATFWIQVYFTYAFAPQTCYFGNFEVLPEYETILPQLEALADKPAGLQAEWGDFFARLLDHEIGHQEIYRNHVPQFLDRLRGLDEWFYPAATQPDCEDRLLNALDIVLLEEFDAVQVLQDDYHARVGAVISWADSPVGVPRKVQGTQGEHAKLRVKYVPRMISPD